MSREITPKGVRVVDYIMHQPTASLVALGIKISIKSAMTEVNTNTIYRIMASQSTSLETIRHFDVYKSQLRMKGIKSAKELPHGELGYMKFRSVHHKIGPNGLPYKQCTVVLTDKNGNPINQ